MKAEEIYRAIHCGIVNLLRREGVPGLGDMEIILGRSAFDELLIAQGLMIPNHSASGFKIFGFRVETSAELGPWDIVFRYEVVVK